MQERACQNTTRRLDELTLVKKSDDLAERLCEFEKHHKKGLKMQKKTRLKNVATRRPRSSTSGIATTRTRSSVLTAWTNMQFVPRLQCSTVTL